jgi:peptidyl-dipeptidase Dcp
MNQASISSAQDKNPLLEDWTAPFGVPPFARIKPEHFVPAFTQAFASHASEVADIAGNPAPATFANTIEALERAGQPLSRVSDVFHLLASAHTNDALLAIERELAPLRARHWNAILLNETLFLRIDALHARRGDLGLNARATTRARSLSPHVQACRCRA